MANLKIPELPLDCILEILNFLKDDKNSLVSCILSNRTWCQLTIPILWYKPFEHLLYREEGAKLIQTYVSLLADSEKQQLTNSGIKIPITARPLFNYAQYLREFDIDHFQMAVQDWHWMLIKDNPSAVILTPFRTRLVGNLIFSHCNGIHYLKINTANSKLIDVTSWADAQLALNTLQKIEVHFDTGLEELCEETISSSFNFLSSTTKTIKQILIGISIDTTVNEVLPTAGLALSKMIEAQNHIESFETNEFWGSQPALMIYQSLQSQTYSLTFLRIKHMTSIDLLFPVLIACINLETLSLDIVEDPKNINFKNFKIPSTPLKLKNIHCWGNYETYGTLEVIEILLKMTNYNLKTLKVKIVTQSFINTIIKYCPNIINLSLVVTNNELPNLVVLLSSLNYLTHFSLGNFIYHDAATFIPNTRFLVNQFNREIAKSLPSTLEYLAIDFCITLEDWKIFLRDSKSKLRELVLYQSELIQDSYLEVIVNYAQVFGWLKVLKYQQPHPWYSQGFSVKALKNAKNFIPVIEKAQPFEEPVYGI
ncbi:1781_t:CDS:1 [Diversispora eburnea]|uniref:1781_t:CDS:1 n=3 Tax=Diversisporales TaxID=214509 RepID=A0A9N8YJY1_9GLOM|nr:1781_t:CDS:1 [Diversispora eburnea]